MNGSTREALTKAFETKHDAGQRIIEAFIATTHKDPVLQKLADDYMEAKRRVTAAIAALRQEGER